MPEGPSRLCAIAIDPRVQKSWAFIVDGGPISNPEAKIFLAVYLAPLCPLHVSVHDLVGGGGSLLKLLLASGCPPQDPDMLDNLRLKLDIILEHETYPCFFLYRENPRPRKSGELEKAVETLGPHIWRRDCHSRPHLKSSGTS
ncbi:hypothetical protein Tco_0546210 [Tanacetum coccineum]